MLSLPLGDLVQTVRQSLDLAMYHSPSQQAIPVVGLGNWIPSPPFGALSLGGIPAPQHCVGAGRRVSSLALEFGDARLVFLFCHFPFPPLTALATNSAWRSWGSHLKSLLHTAQKCF